VTYFNGKKLPADSSVKSITLDEGKGTSYTAAQLLAMSLNTDSTTSDYVDEDGRFDASEMWYDVHEKITNRWK